MTKNESYFLVLVCGEELDKEEVQRQCIEFGVDFILTDRPDVLTEVFFSFHNSVDFSLLTFLDYEIL